MAWCCPAGLFSPAVAAAAATVLVILAAAAGTARAFSSPSSLPPFGQHRLLNPRASRTRRSMLDPKGESRGGGLSPECGPAAEERFRGKNVLLTGASGGLGRALARQLARCGASTLILSGRDEKRLRNVAEECEFVYAYYHNGEGGEDGGKSAGLNIKVIPCDLSDPASVENLGLQAMEACAELGGHDGGNSGIVDVLINNGGVSSRSSFLDTSSSVDELLLRINFLSGSQLAKSVVPSMVSHGSGSIIWISSVQGRVGIPNRTSYAASKFAVQGYCEALRAELASSGVTVHIASPGYIRTDLSRSALRGDGKKHGKMDEATASGADPTEVAATVLDSVADGKSDFIVAATPSARAAIWLRMLAPKFLEKKLAERYEKS